MKQITHQYELSFPYTPSDVFDVFVLQHTYEISTANKHTLLEGSYIIHVWYEYRKHIFPLSDTHAFPVSYFLPLSSSLVNMQREPYVSHFLLLPNGMVEVGISFSFL